MAESGGEKDQAELQVDGVKISVTAEKKSSESDEDGSSGSSSGCSILILLLVVFVAVALFSIAGGDENEGSPVGALSFDVSAECEPGIVVGGQVKVNLLPGARMRTSPGYRIKDDSVDTICCVRLGRRLQVLGGPQMADGICWWRVRDEVSSNEGWVADHTESGRRLLKPSE